MHPLLQEAVGSIIRAGLQVLAGYVVVAGIWTPEDASKYVAAAALAIGALGWSLYQKYGSRLKFVTALAMPAGIPEIAVDKQVATGDTPSVTLPKTEAPARL